VSYPICSWIHATTRFYQIFLLLSFPYTNWVLAERPGHPSTIRVIPPLSQEGASQDAGARGAGWKAGIGARRGHLRARARSGDSDRSGRLATLTAEVPPSVGETSGCNCLGLLRIERSRSVDMVLLESEQVQPNSGGPATGAIGT
jgi:hypothetical protein